MPSHVSTIALAAVMALSCGSVAGTNDPKDCLFGTSPGNAPQPTGCSNDHLELVNEPAIREARTIYGIADVPIEFVSCEKALFSTGETGGLTAKTHGYRIHYP